MRPDFTSGASDSKRTNDSSVGREPGHAALDVEELLGPEVGAKAGFSHSIFGHAQRWEKKVMVCWGVVLRVMMINVACHCCSRTVALIGCL